MNREYYKDINYKPILYYVIFGASEDNPEISRSKHLFQPTAMGEFKAMI